MTAVREAAPFPEAGTAARTSGVETYRTAPRRGRIWLAVGAAGAVAGVAVLLVCDRSVVSGLVDAFRTTVGSLARVRWAVAAVIVALGAAHYLAAAVAARAAAGVRTPFRETVLVQLSAAAANRITPAGLGGSALQARYFNRRAGLTAAGALGAVSALSLLGALTDLAVLSLLITVGRLVGVPGGFSELTVLGSRLQSVGHALGSTLTWVVVAVAGVALGVLLARKRVRLHRDQLRAFCAPAAQLGRRPSRLLALCAGSGGTTLVLSIAFAASTAVIGGPPAGVPFGALMVGYMLGSAAGTSVPVPGGIGTTEATLTGVLVAAHVPLGAAVADVLVFRAITFWAPAVVGVAVARRLRRRGVL